MFIAGEFYIENYKSHLKNKVCQKRKNKLKSDQIVMLKEGYWNFINKLFFAELRLSAVEK
jgi:hypothetical protein